jgi:cytoskeletal protein RodZ
LIEVPRREGLSEIRLAGSDARERGAAAAPARQPAMSALAPAPQNALVRLEPSAAAQLTAPLEARLSAVEAAIEHTSRRFSRERMIYAVVISFLIGLTAITALQAIIDLRRRASAPAVTQTAQSAPKPEATGPTNNAVNATNEATGATSTTDTSSTAKQETAKQDQIARPDQRTGAVVPSRETSTQLTRAAKKAERAARQSQSGVVASSRVERRANDRASASSGGYVVHVLMEVKNGQVTEARVLNPRAGADAYEALALRMARQRRYPDNFTGGDTWKIRVRP